MAGEMYAAIFCVFIQLSHYAVSNENFKITPVDLHYECVHKTGNGENKPPLLLLHGLTGVMSHWDGAYETLAFKTGRRVCRADLRNHGDSPWDDETSVDAMTVDVVHLLDTLGEKTAAILGQSMGGKVAIHTALRYPSRVDRIVTEDIGPSIDPGAMQSVVTFLKMMKNVMEKVPEGSNEKEATEYIMSILKDWMKQLNMSVTAEQMHQTVLPLTCRDGKCRWKTNLDAILRTVETDLDSFWTPSSGLYEGPALFIYGSESEFKVNEDEENIRKLFPKAKLVGIEGAGHAVHAFFSQYEDEVLKFLDEN